MYCSECSQYHLLLAVAEHPEIRQEVANKNEQLAGFLKGMVVNPERMGEVRDMSEITWYVFVYVGMFFLCAPCMCRRRSKNVLNNY